MSGIRTNVNRGVFERIGSDTIITEMLPEYRAESRGVKSTIVLLDHEPGGPRTWTAPDVYGDTRPYRIRAFTVGAGAWAGNAQVGGPSGGYAEKTMTVTPGQQFAYTVGGPTATNTPLGQGTTTSFGGILSCPAAINPNPAAGAVPDRYGYAGTATGGDINFPGANYTGLDGHGGCSSAHRYGPGKAPRSAAGGGWGPSPAASFQSAVYPVAPVIDGWGLGLAPGTGRLILGADSSTVVGGYGEGGSGSTSTAVAQSGGYGGGGGGGSTTTGSSANGAGGPGGGGGATAGSGANGPGGSGLVGVEILG